MSVSAHRGEILHFLGNPEIEGEDAVQYFEDGLLVVEAGRVRYCGPAGEKIEEVSSDCQITEHRNGLILPGFIDTHIHFPQMEVMAAYGTQLLDWLETHTFPAEAKFSDEAYASEVARFFLEQLLANGTTSALVFGTVHPQSVEAFFTEAKQKNLRMICGKVMMDRNAPKELRDTPEQGYQDSRKLIKRWHNKDRLGYAVTPRFAPTSSEAQLKTVQSLIEEFPDVHMHTHLAENREECDWVSSLFPESRSYLDVYDRFKLLGKRSVFAHCIHLSETDWRRLGETESSVAHCPMSNLFIGSGLFSYHSTLRANVNVGLGTDVGGGDSLSILRSINEAYKVQQLQGYNLSPFQSLFLATLGGAQALDLDHVIGNFSIGNEADFIILDYASTPLINFRIKHCRSIKERLFVLQMLGDDRAVRQTYVLGEPTKPDPIHL